MSQIKGSQIFDALAIAALPEHAQVCYLAHKLVCERRPIALDDARAVIRSIIPRHGELEKLALLLVDEVNRQRPIYNARRAVVLAETLRNRPIGERLNTKERRRQHRIGFAIGQFGSYVAGAFSDDVIALLELLKHDHRLYEVVWLDGGVRPVIAALVKVTITGEKNAFTEVFLVYKLPGTSTLKIAEVGPAIDNLRDAWAYQVPKEIVSLKKLGWAFTTDFEAQTLVATGPGGTKVFPWQGSHA